MSKNVAEELKPSMKLAYLLVSLVFGFFLSSEFFAYALEKLAHYLEITAYLLALPVVGVLALIAGWYFLKDWGGTIKVVISGTVLGMIARWIFDVAAETQGWDISFDWFSDLIMTVLQFGGAF